MKKLNLIQTLRSELAVLNKQKDINVVRLKELEELLDNINNELDGFKKESYDIKDEFYDKITIKYMFLTGPVGIVCASIVFFVWNHKFIPNGLSDYFISTGLFGLTLVTFLASSYFFSMNSNLDKFIIKIFPKLQIYYDKILLLKNNIDKKIAEIDKYENEKRILNLDNYYIEEQIQNKKQELDELINNYFDNIENNHVVSEKENKGKTRVRTPKNI